MSINEYCTKIKSMADRLKNLGSSVSENNLVIYAVNGLDSCFATIVKIIHHREPLLTFETARNMLLLEESMLNEQTDTSITFDSSSSSPTILVATNSPEPKGDLYHVTKSSTIATALLSTSSSMWHQCLDHPGDEVLRSLVSRHFMSCNKEKSTHLCHAYQQHVKLLSYSSDSIIEHCFNIIHSDI
ncbi:hypothetical protein Tco_0668678 [Tanacetum coccineum]